MWTISVHPSTHGSQEAEREVKNQEEEHTLPDSASRQTLYLTGDESSVGESADVCNSSKDPVSFKNLHL